LEWIRFNVGKSNFIIIIIIMVSSNVIWRLVLFFITLTFKSLVSRNKCKISLKWKNFILNKHIYKLFPSQYNFSYIFKYKRTCKHRCLYKWKHFSVSNHCNIIVVGQSIALNFIESIRSTYTYIQTTYYYYYYLNFAGAEHHAHTSKYNLLMSFWIICRTESTRKQ